MKKLYRSEKDKMISGVLRGMGEYFDTDPTILRVAFLVFLILTGVFPGVILYIIAAIIIPRHPGVHEAKFTETEHKKEEHHSHEHKA